MTAFKLKLFYVRADNEGTGDNMDLLVRCGTKHGAEILWKTYYDDQDPPKHPQWIGEVPDESVTGATAISWDLINPEA